MGVLNRTWLWGVLPSVAMKSSFYVAFLLLLWNYNPKGEIKTKQKVCHNPCSVLNKNKKKIQLNLHCLIVVFLSQCATGFLENETNPGYIRNFKCTEFFCCSSLFLFHVTHSTFPDHTNQICCTIFSQQQIIQWLWPSLYPNQVTVNPLLQLSAMPDKNRYGHCTETSQNKHCCLWRGIGKHSTWFSKWEYGVFLWDYGVLLTPSRTMSSILAQPTGHFCRPMINSGLFSSTSQTAWYMPDWLKARQFGTCAPWDTMDYQPETPHPQN